MASTLPPLAALRALALVLFLAAGLAAPAPAAAQFTSHEGVTDAGAPQFTFEARRLLHLPAEHQRHHRPRSAGGRGHRHPPAAPDHRRSGLLALRRVRLRMHGALRPVQLRDDGDLRLAEREHAFSAASARPAGGGLSSPPRPPSSSSLRAWATGSIPAARSPPTCGPDSPTPRSAPTPTSPPASSRAPGARRSTSPSPGSAGASTTTPRPSGGSKPPSPSLVSAWTAGPSAGRAG